MYYCEEIESEMVKFYISLSEKDKRRYAAIEAKKMGHGGIKYISERDVQLRIKNQPSLQTAKDEENVG
jgi:hypothetical protein